MKNTLLEEIPLDMDVKAIREMISKKIELMDRDIAFLQAEADRPKQPPKPVTVPRGPRHAPAGLDEQLAAQTQPNREMLVAALENARVMRKAWEQALRALPEKGIIVMTLAGWLELAHTATQSLTRGASAAQTHRVPTIMS